MIDPVLNTNFERTEFSDEAYGALGRTLSFATEYEANCRVLAVILGLKAAAREGNPRFSEEEYQEFVEGLWRKRLYDHVEDIVGEYKVIFAGMRDILAEARHSRNRVAHEATLGVRHAVETDEGRSQILQELHEEAGKLAKANFIICFLLGFATHEPRPRVDYMEEYIQEVQQWITEVEV